MAFLEFKSTHTIRLDASPAVERIVERVAHPSPEMGVLLEALLVTGRELLDSLRAGVELTEANRAEIERLRREKAEHEEVDRLRDEEEAIEDADTVVEREAHRLAIGRLEESQRADRARIGELEAAIKDGLILSADEQVELMALTRRLIEPTPVDPT